jgi:hypothetical protein
MLKFFTSVFLIAAMLVSGLSTISTSAVGGLSDPIECAAPGLFKNREVTGSPCQPCPVDFYCKNDLTKKNGNGETVGRSPEMKGVDGNMNSEVIPCPVGTTTKGHTRFPFGTQKYLITKDDDNAKLGQFAYLAEECVSPEFKCLADEVQIIFDKKPTCSKNCPANEALVILGNTRDCLIKCRDGLVAATSGCLKECAAGEILKATGVVTNGKKETSCVKECSGDTVTVNGSCQCPILTQTLVNNVCVCVLPSVLNTAGTACEVPIVLCPANFYGASQPNCMACPINFTSEAGKALTVKDCKAANCDISGQLRYLDGICYCPNQTSAGIVVAVDGSKKCSTCPANTTSVVIGQETNGQNLLRCDAIIPAAPQAQGGGGLCGDWWLLACVAGAVGVGCLVKLFGFCQGGTEEKQPVYTSTPINAPTNTTTRTDKPVIREEFYRSTAGGKCTDTSANYVNQVIAEGKSLSQAEGTSRIPGRYEGQWHNDSNGQYVWIKTANNGSKATSFSTTIINSQYSVNNALECLMVRYAAMINEPFGSNNYVQSLVTNDILHGFNKRVKAECLNLTKLLSTLEALGYGDSSQIAKTINKYAVYKNGQKVTQSYYSREEARNEYFSNNPSRSNNNSNSTFNNTYGSSDINLIDANYNTSYNQKYTVNDFDNNQSNTIRTNDGTVINTGNIDYGNNPFLLEQGFPNILKPINVNAMDGDTVHDMNDMDGFSLQAYSEKGDDSPRSSNDDGLELYDTRDVEELEENGNGSVYENEGSYAFGFNPDDSTTVSFGEFNLFDNNGVNTSIWGTSTNANIGASCSTSFFGSVNPFKLFGSPLKVSALIENGALNKSIETFGTGLPNSTNTTQESTLDCNNPFSLWGDTDSSFTFSNSDILGLDIGGDNSFSFQEIQDSGLSFSIPNASQYNRDISGLSEDSTCEWLFCNGQNIFSIGSPTNSSIDDSVCKWSPTQYSYVNKEGYGGYSTKQSCLDANMDYTNNYEGLYNQPSYVPGAYNDIGKNDGTGIQTFNPCALNYYGNGECNEQTNKAGILKDQQDRSIGFNCDANYIPGITECNSSNTTNTTIDFNNPSNAVYGNDQYSLQEQTNYGNNYEVPNNPDVSENSLLNW